MSFSGLFLFFRSLCGLEQRVEAFEMNDINENAVTLPIRVVQPGCLERIRQIWNSLSKNKQLVVSFAIGFTAGALITGAVAAVANSLRAKSSELNNNKITGNLFNTTHAPISTTTDEQDFLAIFNSTLETCNVDCGGNYRHFTMYSKGQYKDPIIQDIIKTCPLPENLNCFEKEFDLISHTRNKRIFCLNKKADSLFKIVNSKNKKYCKKEPIRKGKLNICLDKVIKSSCRSMFDTGYDEGSEDGIIWPPSIKTTPIIQQHINSTFNSTDESCFVDCRNCINPFVIHSKGRFNNAETQNDIKTCSSHKSLNCFKKTLKNADTNFGLRNKLVYCINGKTPHKTFVVIDIRGQTSCIEQAFSYDDPIKSCLDQVIKGPCSPMFNVEEHGSGEGSGENFILPFSSNTTIITQRPKIGYWYSKTTRPMKNRTQKPRSHMIKV